MLAACARRSGALLGAGGVPRAEAAATQLLGDVLHWLHASGGFTPAGWSPSTCLPPAAAASSTASFAWAAQLQLSRPLSTSPASLLASDREHASSQQPSSSTLPTSGGGSSGEGAADGSSPAAEAATAFRGQTRQPIVTGTWLDRLPQSWIPYAQLMRIEKPIGTWLLAWPCFWSITLAAPAGTLPDLRLMVRKGVGGVLVLYISCKELRNSLGSRWHELMCTKLHIPRPLLPLPLSTNSARRCLGRALCCCAAPAAPSTTCGTETWTSR